MCLVILSYKFDILNQLYSDKMQKFCTLVVYFFVIFFSFERSIANESL